ncbi:MAG: Asp-tRNA(Asn)/Glu-tRNA(Gln) amidotransferase subunit GatC [Phycisphaeraceae bacterium]|nr:Asp-tRNA(Asn)/Glu-tRNA(Gln) amidotransferase subunit GatC [Phycisphaeraceae bacterium]
MPADADPSLPGPLTDATVRKVASLARLAIADDHVALYQHQLSDVLNYIERLRTLDLEGVEPLTHAGDTLNRMRDDEVGPMLTNADAIALAPESTGPFIKVPKVIGDGGGA